MNKQELAFDFSIAFGRALKEDRLAKNLSQEELGFRCDIDRTYISSVERGTRNPTLQIAFKLARGLNTPLSELIISAERVFGDLKGS